MKLIRSIIPQSWLEWLIYTTTAALISLKLTGLLDWSWIWIFAPMWGSFTTVALIAAFTALGFGVPELWHMWKHKRSETTRRDLKN